MSGYKTQAELREMAGVSVQTLHKIIKHLGIQTIQDSYDKRVKLYSDEQVQQILEMTSRIKYTRKEG